MAESEAQKVKRGVESKEGLGERDYRITIPESANNAGLKEVENFINVSADIPVEIVPDEPFDQTNVMSPETKNALAVEAAAINEYNTRSDHFELLDEALNTMDVKANLHEAANYKVQKDRETAEEEFVNHNFVDANDVTTRGIQTVETLARTEEERDNPHLAYVRAIAASPKGGEELAYKANQLKLMEMIREIEDGMTWTDKVVAFGGLMVPGNTLKDAHDMSGSAFSGETFVRNLVLNYKKASPEEQAQMLPVIKKELFETLDNEFKINVVLEAMLKPGGENDLEIFHNAWAALEFTEIASLGLGLATRAARLAKELNAVKVANEVGNAERATKITSASVLDEGMGTVNGVDRVETANLASPFNLGEIDPAYTAGLSSAVRDDLHQFLKQSDNLRDELQGSQFFLREGLLDQADRAKAEKAFVDNLDGIDDVEKVEVVQRTGTSTVFRMNKGDETTEHVLDLKLNDVGHYENRVTTVLHDFIASPEVVARGELKLATAAAQRQDQAQARVHNALIGFQRIALKDILGPLGLKGLTPSGRKRLAELDHVLKVGDARREVYKAGELEAGVDGVVLGEKQISAYFKMRKLVDDMHTLRNNEMRKEMVVRGERNIHVTDDLQEIGKPFSEFKDAVASLSQSRPQEIFDQALQRGVPLSRIDLEGEYAAGRSLVKVQSPSSFNAEGGRWNYILVNAEDITELPTNVINYRTGYIPKINKNANYFVKTFKQNKVDGIVHSANTSKADVATMRVFDTRQEAEAFAAEAQAEIRANGDATTLVRALEDRQIEREARALGAGFDEGHSLGGSLYTGARKDEELLFGRQGVPLETLGSFEAIGRNMSNLARFIPRNEWRMGLQQKAINTANHILPQGQGVTKFAELAHVPDTQQGRYLKWLHRQVEDWMGFPTKEEQLWGNAVQRMYESHLVQSMPNFAKKSVQYIKHKDPVANARAAAFHSLLGWFNPIQIWVQAQGAAVALSRNILNPVALTRSIRDQSALAASRYAETPEAMAHVAKAFGMKTDELIEMNTLWQRSGLEDSILMTADHAAAMQGHSVAMDALSRTANQGLFFYRKGEFFNRRVSFTTSVREWKAANPGKVLDDNALKDIMKRTNDFMLNLGRANRAAFQKGAAGVTTQFLQVSAKTMETLLGMNKNFTGADRAKMFMTQMLLYGSAGLGASSFGSRTAAGMLGYDTQSKIENDMTPEMRKALNEGFLGWATLAMFDADIEIGKRSSLLSGVSEFTDRMLFEDTPFAEMALGAFGATGTRFWDGMTGTLRPVMYGQASVMDIDPVMAARRMMTTLSTWNNVEKSMLMHNLNSLMTRKGKLIRKRDFTAFEEFAVASGFRLSEEQQYFELENILKAKQQFETKVVDEIVFEMNQYALGIEAGTMNESEVQATSEKIALLYQIMPTEAERRQLRDAVKTRLTVKGDGFSRVWSKFIKEFNDGRVSDLTSMHTKFSAYGIQQKIKSGDEQ